MKNSSTLIGFISAFALHIIIGGLLLLSVDFSSPKEKPKVAIIEASVVSQKLFDDLAERKENKIRAEQQRKKNERLKQQKIAKAKAAKEKAQKVAKAKAAKEKAQKIAKAKAAKEKAQKIAKAKAVKEKAQKIAKAKAAKEKAQKIAKAKADKEKAQKIAKAKAVKEKAEKIAKEKADKIAKEKAQKIAKAKAAKEKAQEIERQRQADLEKQMEAEFADEFSSVQSARQLSEIARYKALIQNKVSRNWQTDPDMKGKSCTLAIRLAPDGLVLSVSRSRGDAKVCASAKRAALKAKTLPIPKDPEIALQFRDFDITLEPDL